MTLYWNGQLEISQETQNLARSIMEQLNYYAKHHRIRNSTALMLEIENLLWNWSYFYDSDRNGEYCVDLEELPKLADETSKKIRNLLTWGYKDLISNIIINLRGIYNTLLNITDEPHYFC